MISDKNLILSFNYLEQISDGMKVNINQENNFGLDALTEKGKEVYQNNHTYFGVKCGDNYLTEYRYGAMLLSSITLEFDSKHDMDNFKDTNITDSKGSIKHDIDTAFAIIQNTAFNYSINGTISFSAF